MNDDATLFGDWFSCFHNFKMLVLLWVNDDSKIIIMFVYEVLLGKIELTTLC